MAPFVIFLWLLYILKDEIKPEQLTYQFPRLKALYHFQSATIRSILQIHLFLHFISAGWSLESPGQQVFVLLNLNIMSSGGFQAVY